MFTAEDRDKILEGLTSLLNSRKENEQDDGLTYLFIDEADITYRDDIYFRLVGCGQFEAAFSLPQALYEEAFPVLDFCYRNNIKVILFTTRVSKDRVENTARDIMKKHDFLGLIHVILVGCNIFADSLSNHLDETGITQNKKNNAYLFSRFIKVVNEFEESEITSKYFKRVFTLCHSE